MQKSKKKKRNAKHSDQTHLTNLSKKVKIKNKIRIENHMDDKGEEEQTNKQTKQQSFRQQQQKKITTKYKQKKQSIKHGKKPISLRVCEGKYEHSLILLHSSTGMTSDRMASACRGWNFADFLVQVFFHRLFNRF